MQIGREVKVPLFADDVILYLENPKEPTKNLLQLIEKSARLQGARSVHKNQWYLYTLVMSNLKTKGRKQSQLQQKEWNTQE